MTADAVRLVIEAVRWSAWIFYWTGVLVWGAGTMLVMLGAVRLVTRVMAWLWGATQDDVVLLKRRWQVDADVAEFMGKKR